MKYSVFILILLLFTFSCKNNDGFAPTSDISYSSLRINPEAIIIPKSTTTRINVYAVNLLNVEENVNSKATCTTSNSMASVDNSGNLTNNYSGSLIQRLTLTCKLGELSSTVDVTIVPAILKSLVITKTNLLMGTNQSQSIQVYGNFEDTNTTYVFAIDMTNYIKWNTTNSAVTTANLGQVSSLQPGVASLTASFGSFSVTTDVTVSSSTSTPSASPHGVGLLGSYYDFGVANPSSVPWSASTVGDPFERLFGQRIDSQVYFNWSTGVNNLGQPYYFGIRWTGKIYIPTTGSYTFYTNTDDGVRLWIDDLSGSPLIDNWTLHASTENTTSSINLVGGQFYNIKMDYFENAGYSRAELRWSSSAITKELIPQTYLFPN